MKKYWMLVTGLLAAATLAVAAETKEVELQGKLGCSHCTYKVPGEECGVAFQTADGKVYVVDQARDDLMKARFKGGQLKVKGTVTEKNGVPHVTASSAELVK